MKVEYVIPKGYSLVRNGSLIKTGDLFIAGNEWLKSSIRTKDRKSVITGPYIRKKKRK
jgi:hypothetical protein